MIYHLVLEEEYGVLLLRLGRRRFSTAYALGSDVLDAQWHDMNEADVEGMVKAEECPYGTPCTRRRRIDKRSGWLPWMWSPTSPTDVKPMTAMDAIDIRGSSKRTADGVDLNEGGEGVYGLKKALRADQCA